MTMERARVLLLAAPSAPVRGLVRRLRGPDLDVVTCSSAREALELTRPIAPDVVVIDGSLPGRDVFRFYSRLRASALGAAVPIIFSNHVRSNADDAPTTAPDYYLPPEVALDDIEQLLFTFLPESLVELEEPAPEPVPPPRRGARSRPSHPSAPDSPTAGLSAQLQRGPTALGLAYLGVFGAGEALGAGLDERLGLLVHAGLMLAVFLQGASAPPGPERTFFWTLWLAPLTRIYALAQPYAGAQPLTWWALTAIPVIVAAVVALRLGGLSARDAGLIPSLRDLPVAVFMVPVGLALGVLAYLLLAPHPVGRELAFGGPALAASIVILNPGVAEEVAFRGVLQRAVVGAFGTGFGILYGALIYAPFIPVGVFTGPGLLALVMTFGVGALLAIVTARTTSILSAAVAHASLAVGLYVLAPFLLPADVAPTPGTPGVPPTVDQRTATARPALPASPSPGGQTGGGQTGGGPTGPVAPPPGGPPAATGKPAQAAQPVPSGPATGPPATTGPAQPPGQTAPALATPLTLATPLPPTTPTSSGPPPSPKPGGPEAIPGQIVVVRGTGGSGARLRSQPGSSSNIITVVPEYTPLVVIGPDRVVDGIVWRNVRTQNGSEGWIAASFVTTGRES